MAHENADLIHARAHAEHKKVRDDNPQVAMLCNLVELTVSISNDAGAIHDHIENMADTLIDIRDALNLLASCVEVRPGEHNRIVMLRETT